MTSDSGRIITWGFGNLKTAAQDCRASPKRFGEIQGSRTEKAWSINVARFERVILLPSLIAIAVMCGALMDEDSLGEALFGRGWDLDWPYGYYIFLRFVVCIASVIVAVNGYQWERMWVPWVFGLQAVLYNPILRVHLNVQAWVFWNLVAIVLFVVAIFAVRPPTEARRDSAE